jgi:protein-S-isoprenylcysteine O-methyltransferase Ste14
MSIFGIGPWLAVAGGAAALLVYFMQRAFGLSLAVPDSYLAGVRVFGVCWGAIGLWFWLGSIMVVVRGHRSHRLVTAGVYRYSRNPMYAAFIVFLVPAISLVSGQLLMLLVSVVMYGAFKVLIRKEEAFLKREFGDEYECYTRRVAQLIPFVRGFQAERR